VARPPESIPDTNVILRYLLEDHPVLSARAAGFFAAVRTGEQRALVSEGVIVECIHMLTKVYRVPRREAATSLMGLLNYRGVANPDRIELFEGLLLYARGKLDIVDAIIVARAARRRIPPFSFDKELMRVYEKGAERPIR
jgi:predicted nucleic-acid-binding protein